MKNTKNLSKKILKTAIVPIIVFVICTLLIPNFRLATVQIVLLQSVIPTVMSYAMCFTIAAGLFDISSGSIIVLAAMIGGKLCGAYGMAGLIVGCVLIALIL